MEKKHIIYGVGGLLGALIIYSFIRRAVKKSEINKLMELLQRGGSKPELDELEEKNIKPAFADKQYKIWADRIEERLSGYTENESEVINIIKNLKNEADWIKLKEAFGIREIKITTDFLLRQLFGTVKVSLEDAIIKWFEARHLKELNKVFINRKIPVKF